MSRIKRCSPPKAKKQTHTHRLFGDLRKDPYFWMKNRDHKDVLKHIKNENKYFDCEMKSTKKLQSKLFKEMKKRIPSQESSVPYKDGSYYYWIQYKNRKEYPIYCRRKVRSSQVEVLLDVNQMAQKNKYYDVGSISLSFSQKIMAFCVDSVGRRFYTIYFKNLETHQIFSQKIKNVTTDFVWGNDDDTLFYVQQDPQTLRDDKVYRYSLKTKKSELIFQEKDSTFNVGLYKTLSDKYIFIQSSSTLTTESRFIRADQPQDSFKIFQKRKRGHKYFVMDGEDRFYILTNSKGSQNYRLDESSLLKHSFKFWKNVLPYQSSLYIEDFEVFEKWIVLEVRKKGLSQILFLNRKNHRTRFLPLKGESYVVGLGTNAEYKTEKFRFLYESMNELSCTYEYHVLRQTKKLLKRRKLAVSFNSQKYVCLRRMVRVRDGSLVPISLLYRKDKFKKGSNPLYQYGYGSYGHCLEPSFYTNIFSLVDRGFVFVLTHVRGGAEMGKHWYEDGKLLKKKNTFYDFIDCSDDLIQKKWVHPQKLYAGGGSAGGLLMGSILNLRPKLYKAIIAHVPFVDVVTTMLDSSVPLTTGEYDEWGNPQNRKFYRYIKSYSPYDNIEKKEYPFVWVTTGYHDSQVQYWEPLKWVARLREHQQASNPILLHVDTESGHSGTTGRYKRLHQLAQEYAFILSLNENS